MVRISSSRASSLRFAPHRDNVLVLSGLTQNAGRALGDAAGDHARASATYLTGVHPGKPMARVSVRHFSRSGRRRHIGAASKLPSLELACEDARLVGTCDSGYSCATAHLVVANPLHAPAARSESSIGVRTPVRRARRKSRGSPAAAAQ